MVSKNSYYSIACSELLYLRDALNPHNCNPAASGVEQVVEKMLKSVAELTCSDIQKLMVSHNLRGIYDAIRCSDTTLVLDRKELALLTDYYYDTRYPGDNFAIVSAEGLREAVEIMIDICCSITEWRRSKGLEILITDPRAEFTEALARFDMVADEQTGSAVASAIFR